MTTLGIDPASSKIAVVCGEPFLEVHKLTLGKKFEQELVWTAYERMSELIARLPLGVERHAFIESPLVGSTQRNIGGTIKQTFISAAIQVALYEWGFRVVLVYPGTWKKGIGVGGNAGKETIQAFIEKNHPLFAQRCVTERGTPDQDLLDAAGIYLYGASLIGAQGVVVDKRSVHRKDGPVLPKTRLHGRVRRTKRVPVKSRAGKVKANRRSKANL